MTASLPEPATDAGPDVAAGLAGDLGGRLAAEIEALDRELTEIEMLVAQAQTEAARHEQRRAQAADKLAAAVNLPAPDLATLNAQLVSLTRRTAVMESQVEVLAGKRKTLGRFRDRLVELGEAYGGAVPAGPTARSSGEGHGPAQLAAGRGSGAGSGSASSAGGAADPDGVEGAAEPMSRIVLNAQEDLRREIARAMHDGPAQSLTNIVLQAQIVERLLVRDPDSANAELRLLVAMVQATLEATKNFIFDVRPMVLDDLGLVPTLRRAARERGRKAVIAVEFESLGQDRRLPVDLESSLFRMIDEALIGYLSVRPDRIAIRLDWSNEAIEAVVSAERDPTHQMAEADEQVAEAVRAVAGTDKNLPPALGSMMADRRERAEANALAARAAAIVALPQSTWRGIEQRATSMGVAAELVESGGTLRLKADLGSAADHAVEPG